MKTTGSILRSQPGTFETAELELDEPRQNELLIRLVASGLCHSDDHAATGDMPTRHLPMCGGHEGSGVVEQVGPNTRGFEVGDHVVMTFLPACGRCLWCARGMQQLCDQGAYSLTGARIDDQSSYRMSLDGEPVGQQLGVSTFSQYTTVNVMSAYKVPKEVPLKPLCLLGCAAGTGWGAAVNAAEVTPGDVVIVMGVGGAGMSAVQGAAAAGAASVIVVDPVPYKREAAKQFGATDTFETLDEATEAARAVTNGQGADSTIVTIGVVTGDHISGALESIRKGGTVAMTGMGKSEEPMQITTNALMYPMMQKRLQGVIFGNWSPFKSVPTLLHAYTSGLLKLDEMMTKSYTIDQVAKGYEDMHAGDTVRGWIDYES